MAVNPMQRKARISFILGFITMLVIAIIVGVLLFMQILNLEKEKQEIASKSKNVAMLTRDIKSGEAITSSDIKNVSVVTNMVQTNAATMQDLTETSIAKIDIPLGAILTKSMITTTDETVTDDLRLQEYNMIVLPSDLTANDYIDIRIQYPNGQNYIVLPKKRVVSATQNTIFIKVTELDIQMMTNAIVESYMLEGSILYASKLEDAGIQNALKSTYVVSEAVYNMIQNDANVVTKAKNELIERISSNINRRAEINGMLNENSQGITGVQAGLETQIQRQNSERSKYLDALGLGE